MESQASSEGDLTAAGAPALSPGVLLAGKYRVRRPLDGARGVLLEAVQETVDLRVVVQVLPADRYDALERERFRREASALVRLESEHAARILDVGALEDGSLFSVRQFLDGEPLDTWAARSERVSVEEAVLLVLQAADAVAEAHGHGVVLRELSPGHLFVSRRPGGAAMVRVVDFGMAKLARDPRVTEEVTAIGLVGLSPYASPEMVRRSRLVDVRSDVWSLGAILHLLLGGRPPFEGDESELMLAILKERPRALAAERGDVPRALDEVLRWAMAKDLDERFRDVHALAHALEPFASAEGKVLVARIAQTSAEAKRRRRHAIQEERARGAAERAATESARAPQISAPVAGPDPEAAPSPAEAPVAERPRGAAPRASNASEEITRAAPLPDPRAGARRGSDVAAETGPARAREAGQTLRVDPQRGGPTFAGAAADMGLARSDAAQSARRPTPSPPAGRTPSTPPPGRTPSTPPPGRTPSTPPPGRTPSTPPPGRTPSTPPPARTPSTPPPPVHVASAAASPVARPPPGASAASRSPPGGLGTFKLVAAGLIFAALPVTLAFTLLGPSKPDAEEQGQATALAPAQTGAGIQAPSTPAPEVVVTPTNVPPTVAAPAGSSTGAARAGPGAPVAPTPTSRPAAAAQTAPTAEAGAATGTLVAVAVGGSCAFLVNGVQRGSGASLKLALKPGSYSVTCKPPTGERKSRNVVISSGGTAMATFKL